MIDTPTRGMFRRRTRNRVYFTGSGTHERGGMYEFWIALESMEKQWSRRRQCVRFQVGRARVGLRKEDRFTRIPLDALKKPDVRKYLREQYRNIKKPIQVKPADSRAIEWWLSGHPKEATYAKFNKNWANGYAGRTNNS